MLGKEEQSRRKKLSQESEKHEGLWSNQRFEFLQSHLSIYLSARRKPINTPIISIVKRPTTSPIDKPKKNPAKSIIA